jgi:hypothetical protein
VVLLVLLWLLLLLLWLLWLLTHVKLPTRSPAWPIRRRRGLRLTPTLDSTIAARDRHLRILLLVRGLLLPGNLLPSRNRLGLGSKARARDWSPDRVTVVLGRLSLFPSTLLL